MKELYVPVMKGKRQAVVEGYSCGYILHRDPRVPEHVEAGIVTQKLVRLSAFSRYLGLKWRASSSDTAVGVFGIIHRLGACERTTSSGLGSREGLRACSGGGGDRRVRYLGETILHGCGLSLVRRRANFNDMTMSGRWGRGKLWIGWDACESVSGARGGRGDRRKNGRSMVDHWRWSTRRERTVFHRSRGRHLALDVVELLLVVERVVGAWWATTTDLGVAGLLLEGIRRRRIVDRRVRERGGGATTRTKGSVGRRG